MNVRSLTRCIVMLAVLAGLGGCSSMGGGMSLFDQLGGMNQVRSLADAFVNNAAGDSRTSQMLSNANLGSLKTKVSDQFCAMAGGGCRAPLTDSQITDAGKKVDAKTSSSLTDSLGKALDTIKATPVLKEGVTRLLGPRLGGIVSGLL